MLAISGTSSMSMIFSDVRAEVLWRAKPADKAHRRTDDGNHGLLLMAGDSRDKLSRKVVAISAISRQCWSEWQDLNLRPPVPRPCANRRYTARASVIGSLAVQLKVPGSNPGGVASTYICVRSSEMRAA